MTYQLHLQAFEGPFDLLLHLIRINQVDVYDIPIAEITQQYLDYLHTMKEMDLEIASSFLVMAANLLNIKAKMLVPALALNEGEEVVEDVRQELVQDILEYLRFQEIAEVLEQLSQEESQHYSRPNEESFYVAYGAAVNPLQGKILADLQKAFKKVLQNAEGRETVLDITRSVITVQEKIENIYAIVQLHPSGICFNDFFLHNIGRMEIIVTFLSLLELMRRFVITARQNDAFGDIFIYPGRLFADSTIIFQEIGDIN